MTLIPALLLQELREGMKEYCDNDYVMMIGNPTVMVLSALIAAERNEGRVNILYWRREQRRYTVVNIDLEAQPPLKNKTSARKYGIVRLVSSCSLPRKELENCHDHR
jgi:hypothetical protein